MPDFHDFVLSVRRDDFSLCLVLEVESVLFVFSVHEEEEMPQAGGH